MNTKIDAEVAVQRSDEDKAVWYMTWDQEQMAAESRGKAEGKAEDVKAMKADGLPIEKIMQYTGLSRKEIELIEA